MENATVAIEERPEIIRIIEKIQLYYTPLLVLLGTLGNCLCVIVFFCTKLRKLSSSYYLSALAISDTGFLFVILISWLNLVDIPLFNKPVICEMSVYVGSVCSFLSVWFVVAFTVERFIAVRYPLKRPSMCTVSRAKMVIGCLTGASAFFYLPNILIAGLEPKEAFNQTDLEGLQPLINLSEPISFIGTGNESNVLLCGLKKNYYDLGSILNGIDFLIVLILPVIAIFMINTSICTTVWKLARVRRMMTLSTAGQNGVNGERTEGRMGSSIRSHSSQSKITKMLLTVSTVFICLNLPSYIFRLILHFQEKDFTPSKAMVAGQQVSYILFNTNFGINFVLYCISGQNFRKALIALWCPRKPRMTETTRVTESGRSMSARRRTIAVNGSLREAYELLPLSH